MERVSKRVGRILRRPEGETLRLQIGVLDGEAEYVLVEPLIFGEVVRKLRENLDFRLVIKRLKGRAQRADIFLYCRRRLA